MFEPDDGQGDLLIHLVIELPEHRFRQGRTTLNQLADAGQAQVIGDNIVEIRRAESVRLQDCVDELLILFWVKLTVCLEPGQTLFGGSDLFRGWIDLKPFRFVAQQEQIPGEAQKLIVSGASVRGQLFQQVIHAEGDNQLNASLDLLDFSDGNGAPIEFSDASTGAFSVTHGGRIVNPAKSHDNNDRDEHEQSPLPLANRFQHREEKGGCSRSYFQ